MLATENLCFRTVPRRRKCRSKPSPTPDVWATWHDVLIRASSLLYLLLSQRSKSCAELPILGQSQPRSCAKAQSSLRAETGQGLIGLGARRGCGDHPNRLLTHHMLQTLHRCVMYHPAFREALTQQLCVSWEPAAYERAYECLLHVGAKQPRPQYKTMPSEAQHTWRMECASSCLLFLPFKVVLFHS